MQFALAREYGFSSWRSLKAHVEALNRESSAHGPSLTDEEVGVFLRAVGAGNTDAVRSALSSAPQLVNAVGPHPYWGGRPQSLHVSIETRRDEIFDLLLGSGADVDGTNEDYEHCSPLMLTVLWQRPHMQQELLRRGAKVRLVEALLLGDDALVTRLLRAGRSALPRQDTPRRQGSVGNDSY